MSVGTPTIETPTRYMERASRDSVAQTMRALAERGIPAEVVGSHGEAIERVKAIIPSGSTVMTSSSVTLREIGLEAYLAQGDHVWNYLKPAILAEKDEVAQSRLRRQAAVADYTIGSVQAITEAGEVVIASGTGSQISPYAYASANIVWIVGTHKIVRNLDEAMHRVREYCVPRVSAMASRLGRPDAGVLGKTLIFERELAYTNRKIRVLFLDEVIGI